MPLTNILIMSSAGLAAGILAGFLGIGGGVLMVPILLMLGFDIDQATATSLLAILVTASTGSLQNWRMGHLAPRQVLLLAIPAIFLVVLGTEVGSLMPDILRQSAFGVLLLINLYLVNLKKQAAIATTSIQLPPAISRIITGGTAGFMAGLFGVGGGIIMVPLQLLLMHANIKQAVRNSLGVIVLTSLVACIHNILKGNIVLMAGLSMGFGGLIGVQISTRFLPKLSDQIITKLFRGLSIVLALYVFGQAWLTARP